VLDVRFAGSDGEHLMGEEFASVSPVRLRATVFGTAPVARVDVIKDGKVVFSREPNREQAEVEFQDGAVGPGRSHYYVRVRQRDGEMAWGSPAWVTYGGRSGSK
jgi:hypothetical protein